MRTVAVIPARYASTRLPAKALAAETGKYLVQHVYERVHESGRLDQVLVATDDERIVAAVKSFGGEVRMTRADHVSGTDRVAEIADNLGLSGDDIVLNVQGDEAEITADVVDGVVESLANDTTGCRIATAAAPFDEAGPKSGPSSPLDPNRVKVVLDERGRALYFSRSPIPYPRDTGGAVDRPSRWLLHLGVYAFRADTLRLITSGGSRCVNELERAESLEQLRWLAAGHSIAVVKVQHRFIGIDTPEDYAAFVRRVKSTQSTGQAAHATTR